MITYVVVLLAILSPCTVHAMDPQPKVGGGAQAGRAGVHMVEGVEAPLGVLVFTATSYAFDWLCEPWRRDRAFTQAILRINDRIESYAEKLNLDDVAGGGNYPRGYIAYLADRHHNHLGSADITKACNKLTIAIDHLEQVRRQRTGPEFIEVEKVLERFKYYRESCIAYKRQLYAADYQFVASLSAGYSLLLKALEMPNLGRALARFFAREEGDVVAALEGVDRTILALEEISKKHGSDPDFAATLCMRRLFGACRTKLAQERRICSQLSSIGDFEG